MALMQSASDAKTVTIYKSDERQRFAVSKTKLVSKPELEFGLTKVYPAHKKQEVIGFGGAFTEAAAHVFAALSPASQDAVLNHYFSEQGCAYNLCRTHIQSCDFAQESYAYVTDKKDKELASFSIEHDLKEMVPFMKRACEVNPDLEILASPWSPPAFMKTNRMMKAGGSLKEKYYSRWALMMARYVKEMREQNIPITRVTVQNEPLATQVWDSCIYMPAQERLFACNYLKPALEDEGLGDVKILIWDHNKDRILDRAVSVLGYDPKADNDVATASSAHVAELKSYVKNAIDGIAFHWYTGDHFEALAETARCFADYELIMTEMCTEYKAESENDVLVATRYAHELIGDFNAGAQGFIDWNLLLDANGGPNHARNFCNAPLMAGTHRVTSTEDVQGTESEVSDAEPPKDAVSAEAIEFVVGLESIYIAHVSRFVKRGARRILVSRATDVIDAVGFVNPDGSTVVVVLNKSEKPYELQLAEGELVAATTLAPFSIATLMWEKW